MTSEDAARADVTLGDEASSGDLGTFSGNGEDAGQPLASTFVYFTLEGERFNTPGLPVGNAREVGPFRDALFEMARSVWLEANPDRQRVPGGFEENLDLRLMAVDEGSARLRLRLHRPSRFSDDEWDPLERAYIAGREALTEAMEYVANNGELPPHFPAKARRSIKNIGGTLGDGERLVFGSPTNAARRVVVDNAVRDLLDQIDSVLPPPTPQEYSLTGVLTEFDGIERSFQIRTEVGLHTCRLEAGNSTIARLVHNHVAHDGITAPDVKVTGLTTDPDARRVELFNVDTLEVLRSIAEKAVMRRLEQIRQLRPGWNGPDTEVPSDEVRQRVEAIAPVLATLGLPVTVVPNSDGAIVLEWRRGKLECTATIEGNGSMYLSVEDVDTGGGDEYEGDYNELRLLAFLRGGVLD